MDRRRGGRRHAGHYGLRRRTPERPRLRRSAGGRRGTRSRRHGGGDRVRQGLLEIFARHFLNWVNRWQDDGFDPIRTMWLRHAPGHGEKIELELGGERLSGTFGGIDDDGALQEW